MQKLHTGLYHIIFGLIACMQFTAAVAGGTLLLMRDPFQGLSGIATPTCSGDGMVCAAPAASGTCVDVSEAATGRVLWRIPIPGMLGSMKVALSQDGKLLAVTPGSGWQQWQVFDITTRQPLFARNRGFFTPTGEVVALDFSPDGRLLAVLTDMGVAEIWATDRRYIRDGTEGFGKGAQAIRVGNDGRLTAFMPGGTAQVWQAGQAAVSSISEKGPVVSVGKTTAARVDQDTPYIWADSFALTAQDRLLIPGSPGEVFDLRTGSLTSMPQLGAYPDGIDGFDVSNPDVVAVWTWTTGYLADAHTLQPIAGAHWPTSQAMAISPDGNIVALKRDNSVVVVDRVSGQEKTVAVGWDFKDLRFSADGKAIVTRDDSDIRAYSVVSGEQLWLPHLYGGRDAVSADLLRAVQVQTGQSVRILDIARRRGMYELPLQAQSAVFSRDGKRVAVVLLSGPIVVVDVESGRREAVLAGFPTNRVGKIQFTADGRRLIASDGQMFASGWDLATQRKLFTFSEQHGEWVVATPAGFYDGSRSELEHYYWVDGVHTYPLDARAPQHRVPGLMATVWRGEPPPRDALETGTALGNPDIPVPRLRVVEPGGSVGAQPDWLYTVETDSPAVELIATRNGVPQEVSASGEGQNTFRVRITPVAGLNRIRIWAVDGWGRQSSEIVLSREVNTTISLQPEVVTQLKSSQIGQVALSRDSSLMATTTGHAISLWDLRTRRLLRTILKLSAPATHMEFGASADVIAATDQADGVLIFDTRTAEETCRLETLGRNGGVHDAPFSVSPDGERIAMVDDASLLTRIFRLRDCTQESSFDSGAVAPTWVSLTELAIQAPGKLGNELIRVELDDLRERHLKVDAKIRSIHAMPDGRLLVLLEDGRLQVEDSTGGMREVRVDAVSGEKIRQVVALRSGRVWADLGKTQVLLGKELNRIEQSWKEGYLDAAAVSADERWVALASTAGSLGLYAFGSSQKQAIAADAGFGPVTELAFSPEGNILVTGRGTAGAFLPGSTRLLFWDIATSSVVHTVDPANNLIGIPIANWFISNDLTRVSLLNGAIIRTVPFSMETLRGEDGRLNVKDINIVLDAPKTAALPGPQRANLLDLQAQALSASGEWAAATGKAPGSVQAKKLSDERTLVIRAHPNTLRKVAIDAGGTRLLTYGDGSRGESVRMWAINGQPQWSLEGQGGSIPAMGFSNDGRMVALAADGQIRVLDSSTGAERQRLDMEPAEATAVAFSPDNRRLAVGTADGVTHLYEWEGGKLLATFAAEAEGSLVYTPDAFYSGTLTHSAALSFRLGNHVYPLRQFDLYYHRPDVVMQRLAPELGGVIRAYYLAYLRRLREAGVTKEGAPVLTDLPVLSIKDPPDTTVDSSTLALAVTAKSGLASPLRMLEVRVNGALDQRIDLKGRKAFEGQVSIALSSGKNQIELAAVDSAGRRSLTEELAIQSTVRAPSTLYVLAIGLSRYSDPEERLDLGAKDAADLAQLFREQARTLGGKAAFDKVVVFDSITNEAATAGNIREAAKVLAQASVNDAVVLFFAGHGVVDDQLDFYFAPYDMKFSAPRERGISIGQMESMVGASRSRRRLLLIDACQAGELDKSGDVIFSDPDDHGGGTHSNDTGRRGSQGGVETVSRINTINAFELLRSFFVDLRENTGTQIISATRGRETASEPHGLENGLFTHAVLDGLKDDTADIDGDGHVSVSELLQFVSDDVRKRSNGKQTPTERQGNLEGDFVLQ